VLGPQATSWAREFPTHKIFKSGLLAPEKFQIKFAHHYRGREQRQLWGYGPATRHRAEKIRSGRDQTNNVRSNNK
jgi:hypothetical protein